MGGAMLPRRHPRAGVATSRLHPPPGEIAHAHRRPDRRPGGPEEMKLVDLPVWPGPGQVRIRHHAIGLNFIDVYQRTGLYPLPMP